ncbi:hypothetical protein BST28_04900 [Mycolicibacter kumamotonensis]|jgi:hypothetical protein|uniref:DUF732 domain-containing protein n=1 Tax=Mycolicibacter kumamotonensis TaxID=354243 RepID=A0A1X0EBC6_9MYCO|nr:DUF732 domain-containing protein [Mycolicibacter kumamotonensis]ORA81825.1 hypothetical protein BST28_04900 [Mycolicibacter kumamotonensis]
MGYSRARTAVPTATALTAAGAVWAGLIASVWLATPAEASPVDTSFLSELAGAGVPVGDPAATTALGQSVCPMLTEPAGTAASVASPIAGLGGGPAMSPEMAQMFTEVAVQAYCPQMLSQLASGQVPELPQIPGMSVGIPGLSGGLPAIPEIPGLPVGL